MFRIVCRPVLAALAVASLVVALAWSTPGVSDQAWWP